MKKPDEEKAHLQFIYDRLKWINDNHESVDFMVEFKRIIDNYSSQDNFTQEGLIQSSVDKRYEILNKHWGCSTYFGNPDKKGKREEFHDNDNCTKCLFEENAIKAMEEYSILCQNELLRQIKLFPVKQQQNNSFIDFKLYLNSILNQIPENIHNELWNRLYELNPHSCNHVISATDSTRICIKCNKQVAVIQDK